MPGRMGLMNITYLAPIFYRSVVHAAEFFGLYSTHSLLQPQCYACLDSSLDQFFRRTKIHKPFIPAITLTSEAFQISEV